MEIASSVSQPQPTRRALNEAAANRSSRVLRQRLAAALERRNFSAAFDMLPNSAT
jgi:hypothetical protein